MTSFGRGDMVGRAYILVTADTHEADRQIKDLARQEQDYDRAVADAKSRLNQQGHDLEERDIKRLADRAVRENERIHKAELQAIAAQRKAREAALSAATDKTMGSLRNQARQLAVNTKLREESAKAAERLASAETDKTLRGLRNQARQLQVNTKLREESDRLAESIARTETDKTLRGLRGQAQQLQINAKLRDEAAKAAERVVAADTDKTMRSLANQGKQLALNVKQQEEAAKTVERLRAAQEKEGARLRSVQEKEDARLLRSAIDNEKRRRAELENTVKKFKGDWSTASADIGKLLGKGSRNNFLNAFGSFASLPGELVSGVVKGIGGAFEKLSQLGDIFAKGGFGEGMKALQGSAAKGVVGLASLGASAVGLTLALGPLAAGLSLAAGAVTAFVGSLAVGTLGAIAALGPAALAGAAGLSVLFIAFAHWRKTATDADKETVKPITDAWKEMQATVRKNVFGDISKEVPVLKAAMGPFIGMLNQTAKEMNNVGNAAAVMFSAKDSKNLQAYKGLMEGLPKITALWGAASVSAGGALVGVMNAALPIAIKLADKVRVLADRFDTWANAAAGQDLMGRFFDRAFADAQKIMTIISELTKALAFLFNMGDQTVGAGFLDSWIKALQNLNAWLRQNTGSVAKWFEDSKRFASGIGEIFKAVGRIFDTLDTGKSRNQIILLTDVIVAGLDLLNGWIQRVQAFDFSFLTESFKTLASAVKADILPPLKQLFDEFTAAGAITTFTVAMSLLTDLMPAFGAALGLVADAVGLLHDLFNAMPDSLQKTLLLMLALSKVWGPLSLGIARAILAFNGFLVSMSAAKLATEALQKAMSKLLLFGAIALAFQFFEEMGQGAKSAKEAQDKYNDSVQTMAGMLQSAGGATVVFQDQLTQSLRSGQLAETGKLLDRLGLSATAFSKAAAEGGPTLDAFEKSMLNSGDAAEGTGFQHKVLTLKIQEAAQMARDAAGAFDEWRKENALLAAETTPADVAVADFKAGVKEFADVANDADSKTRGFTAALAALAGGDAAMSLDVAIAQAAQDTRDLVAAFNHASDGGLNLADAFVGVTTQSNPTSAAFLKMNDLMTDQFNDFAKVTKGAYDNAGGANNLTAATEAASAAAGNYNQDLANQLVALGLTQEQAQELIHKYGLIPGNVTTTIAQAGATDVQADLDETKTKAEQLASTDPVIRVFGDFSAWEQSLANARAGLASIQVASSAGAPREGFFLGPAGAMTGRIVDKPTLLMTGERSLREAIVPLDLPLNRVNPAVRPMAAVLRGQAPQSSMGGASSPTHNHNVTMNVYPNSADPKAVARNVLNRLASGARYPGPS